MDDPIFILLFAVLVMAITLKWLTTKVIGVLEVMQRLYRVFILMSARMDAIDEQLKDRGP